VDRARPRHPATPGEPDRFTLRLVQRGVQERDRLRLRVEPGSRRASSTSRSSANRSPRAARAVESADCCLLSAISSDARSSLKLGRSDCGSGNTSSAIWMASRSWRLTTARQVVPVDDPSSVRRTGAPERRRVQGSDCCWSRRPSVRRIRPPRPASSSRMTRRTSRSRDVRPLRWKAVRHAKRLLRFGFRLHLEKPGEPIEVVLVRNAWRRARLTGPSRRMERATR
jgi:hypothetical protein